MWLNKAEAEAKYPDVTFIGTTFWICKEVHIGKNSIINKGIDFSEGVIIRNNSIIGEKVKIGRNASIGERVEIGRGVEIYEKAILFDDVKILKDAVIHRCVRIYCNASIGENVSVREYAEIERHSNVLKNTIIYTNASCSGENISENRVFEVPIGFITIFKCDQGVMVDSEFNHDEDNPELLTVLEFEKATQQKYPNQNHEYYGLIDLFKKIEKRWINN